MDKEQAAEFNKKYGGEPFSQKVNPNCQHELHYLGHCCKHCGATHKGGKK